MQTARGPRAGLADMPPGIIIALFSAAHPDEAATAAALSATCRVLRHTVLSCCVSEVTLQRFGRSQQIAPLIQRLSGTNEHCACFFYFGFSMKFENLNEASTAYRVGNLVQVCNG